MADNESISNNRQELFALLRELIQILDGVIYENNPPLPVDLRGPMREAWADFHERHQNRIFAALEVAPEYDEQLTAADRELGRMSLEGVGLTGPHLLVKSRGFRGATRRYILHRVLKELQNLLAWGDIWLESLTRVIQVSEILVELKQVIEKALDMLNEE
jgi:hypothetical protein